MAELFKLGKAPRKESIMSKKKKHPVRKMSEQDYANYIMALKDERPILMPIDDGQKKDERE